MFTTVSVEQGVSTVLPFFEHLLFSVSTRKYCMLPPVPQYCSLYLGGL